MWHHLQAPGQSSATRDRSVCLSGSADAGIRFNLCLLADLARAKCVATADSMSVHNSLVLGFGLLIFGTSSLLQYSFHGGVPMRGEHGREGAGCNDGISALTGHLRGKALKCWLQRSPLLLRVARIRIVCCFDQVPTCCFLLSTRTAAKKNGCYCSLTNIVRTAREGF